MEILLHKNAENETDKSNLDFVGNPTLTQGASTPGFVLFAEAHSCMYTSTAGKAPRQDR